MGHIIRNYTDIATTPLRTDALDIVEEAYKAIDTYDAVVRTCRLTGTVLTLKDKHYQLDAYEHVYLLGFGKASCTAMRALEDILTDHISAGITIDKQPGVCKRVKVFQGAHPIPSNENVAFSREITDMALHAGERDLVIVVVSGGGSSLLCWPASECEQEQKLYTQFLSTGGTIEELNTVRKHISEVKGGGLAKMLYPATVATLIFSDVPGERYDMVASGPTYRDTSTILDAHAVLEQYHLTEAFELIETPKDEIFFEKVSYIPIVSNIDAIEGMSRAARERGYEVIVQSTAEYREASMVLQEMKAALVPKTAVVVAGEPSVAVHTPDTAGRSEYAGVQAMKIVEDGEVCIPFASDGIDNLSTAAGCIIDTQAIRQAHARGVDIEEHIRSGTLDALCAQMGVQIFTGPTGSNVSDCILYIRQ